MSSRRRTNRRAGPGWATACSLTGIPAPTGIWGVCFVLRALLSPAPPGGLATWYPKAHNDRRACSSSEVSQGHGAVRLGDVPTLPPGGPSGFVEGAPQGVQRLRMRFLRCLLMLRTQKPHADEQLPRQTFLFPISKRKIANLLQLDPADVSICGVSMQ